MEPKTCHHCGYQWTPRKENPKKCPQCMNPLWKSPRPKKTGSGTRWSSASPIAAVDDGVKNREGRSSPSTAVDSGDYLKAVRIHPEPQNSECAQAPIEKDSLSEAKAKAEELFRRLTV